MSAEAFLSASSLAAVRDVRSIRRWSTALCMVVGPLAIAVIRGLIPYFTSTNGGAGQVAGYAAHPEAYPAIAGSAFVGVIAMWVAMQGAGRLIQGRTPRLALVAVPLATAGWMMVAVLASEDSLAYQLTRSGIPLSTGGALVDRVSNDLFTQLAFSLFISGHLIGTLLIGIGLILSQRVPVWAGIAVIGGTVLHPIAFLLLHIQALDAFSYVVVAVGLAAAAREVLATLNDEWDLPPAARVRLQ